MNVGGSYKATKLIFGKEPDEIAQKIESLLHLKPPSSFMGKIEMFKELFSLKSVFPKRMGHEECTRPRR